MSFEDKTLVEIERGTLIKAYAALATGSYVPSMFADVRDVMVKLDATFGVRDEANAADRDSDNGSDS